VLDKIIIFWKNNNQIVFDLTRKTIASLVVVIVCILITKGFKRFFKNAASRNKLRVDDTASSILRHVVSYGISIICIIIVLSIFDINTTSLLAVLGATGIAVGLAVKDTLSNIAAGIILFFLGSYRIGEFIEFGTFMGTVKEINPFTTILETPDGIYISAPNSCIWNSPLRNYSRNGKRRMELSIRISYSDSLDTAFNVLNNLIASETRFMREPAPQIIVQSMHESFVNLVIRAWTLNNDYWDVYWYQMRNLKEKIEKASLHIPFPQHDVHIIQNLSGT
jgi:small conductance mechanosensitive channel